MAAEVAAALAAAEAEARYSGLEDEEGEGRWKPAAGAAPSTLASADRTRVGKVVGFFGRSVCPRVCVYLSRTVSEYRFSPDVRALGGPINTSNLTSHAKTTALCNAGPLVSCRI